MHLFQIFYNEATQANLDPDFIPLDNTNSERPDWFEYWPIRQTLLSKKFEDEEYLGFFSPRFKEKTGLSGAEVMTTVRGAAKDVVSFSPFLDLNALFLNSFYQADDKHPGCLALSQEYLDSAGVDIKLSTLVQDQTRIIFSNYFVAKYGFWKKWMKLSDHFFDAAEERDSSIAKRLNAGTHHRGQMNYSMKIFIMERIVSLVLELENMNAEIGVDHAKTSPYGTGHIFNNLLILDALKGQFVRTRSDYFIGIYMSLRKELVKFAERLQTN